MKAKTNNPTRSAPASHNGRTGKDANAIYEITFRYKQWGIRYIKANSPAQAREKARSLTTLKGFWQDYHESFDIEEILVIDKNALPRDATITEIPT